MVTTIEQQVRIFEAMKMAVRIARLTDAAPAAASCPWCPDFVSEPGASHIICASCTAKMNAEMDRLAPIVVGR